MPEIKFGLETSDVFALTDEMRVAESLNISFSVSFVPPYNNYLNTKYPRHQGFYGYAQLMFGAFVRQNIQLEHINQLLYFTYPSKYNYATSAIDQTRFILAKLGQATPESAVIVKLYEKLTAIRFRLRPSVRANLIVTWDPLVLPANTLYNEPDNYPSSRDPSSPQNLPIAPSQQPSNTEIDLGDPTGNDGDDPNAPVPEGSEERQGWLVPARFGPPADASREFFIAANINDIVTTRRIGPNAGLGCPEGRGEVLVNGEVVYTTENCVSPLEEFGPPYYVE